MAWLSFIRSPSRYRPQAALYSLDLLINSEPLHPPRSSYSRSWNSIYRPWWDGRMVESSTRMPGTGVEPGLLGWPSRRQFYHSDTLTHVEQNVRKQNVICISSEQMAGALENNAVFRCYVDSFWYWKLIVSFPFDKLVLPHHRQGVYRLLDDSWRMRCTVLLDADKLFYESVICHSFFS